MPEWNRLAIDARWVRGWANWREYWMKACTSPMVIAPEEMRSPPTTATSAYCTLPRNIISGWISEVRKLAWYVAS